MVMVMFATPVILAWCLMVSVRALFVPPIAVDMSAGKIRFGLSLVTVMRAPVVALFTNEVLAVSASPMVKLITGSVTITPWDLYTLSASWVRMRGLLSVAFTTRFRLPVTGLPVLFAVVTLRLSTSGATAPEARAVPSALAFM